MTNGQRWIVKARFAKHCTFMVLQVLTFADKAETDK